MSAIINTTLTSIVTKESFIINRERIDGDEMKLIISEDIFLMKQIHINVLDYVVLSYV